VPGLTLARPLTSLIPSPGPRRPYALAVFVNSLGFGMLVVSMPLYFTRIVHLSVGQVGLGLTIAAAIGLAAGVPIGRLADRRGPLGTAQIMLLTQFGSGIAFLFIRNFAGLVAVVTVEGLASSGWAAADGALLRRLAGDDAAGFRASTHALFNVGLALGTACSSIAIQIGTPAAYHALIIINAASYLGALVALRRLPRYDPLPTPAAAARWGVLADRPFVAFTALTGVISVQFMVIPLLLPLWVADHTQAPRWCIPMAVLVNTILVALLQAHIGSRVQTIRQGGGAYRRAGVIFLVSCSAIGLASGLPAWAALTLLAAGVCLHTMGELWHMAGTFALAFGLAPAHEQGQYMGFLGIGTGMASAAAPVLLLVLILDLGKPGLIGLGAFFALAGLLMPAVARWGERTRPPAASPASQADLADAEEAPPAH
jgi:MFS family permease